MGRLLVLVILLLPSVGYGQEIPISRREYEVRIAEMDRRITQRFDLNEIAVSKALESMNLRLDGMNEFRSTLKDQAVAFATRDGLETVDRKVQALELARSNSEGRSQQTILLMGVAFTIVNVVMAIYLRRKPEDSTRSK